MKKYLFLFLTLTGGVVLASDESRTAQLFSKLEALAGSSNKPSIIEVQNVLVNFRGFFNCKNAKGLTPLMYLAQHDDSGVVIGAIASFGARINVLHQETHMSALHYAAQSGNMAAIEALLYWSANPLAKDKGSKTSYNVACEKYGQDSVVALRLKLSMPKH